jgi:hypothetical protein
MDSVVWQRPNFSYVVSGLIACRCRCYFIPLNFTWHPNQPKAHGYSRDCSWASEANGESRKMIRLFCALVGLTLLSACAKTVLLVNPKTGGVVQCSTAAPLRASSMIVAEVASRNCVSAYVSLGYVPADSLTEEQKANLPALKQEGGTTIVVPDRSSQPTQQGPTSRSDPNELIMRCGGRAVDFVTGQCM